jgi:hypothetical protein
MNAEEGWVRVQPGLVLDTLNAALKAPRAAIWPRPGVEQPRLSGRHRLQQRHGQPLDPLRHDGRSRAGDEGDPRRRLARALPPAGRRELRGNTQQSGARRRDLPPAWQRWSTTSATAIIRAGTPRHWRRCGGYNLARFIHDGSIDHYLPQDSASTWSTCWPAPKARWRPSPNSSSSSCRDPAHCAGDRGVPTLLTSLQATPAILETNPPPSS